MLVKDPDYPLYGPIGLISTLHKIYGRLITDRDWPALATKLPQSNNAATSSRPSSSNGTAAIKCFRCQGPHLIKDCPKKSKGTTDKNNASEPAPKKAKTNLPAWQFAEPKNLTQQPLVDDDGRKWKFCTKCVCKKSGKTGMYLLSHFDHEHQDNYVRPSNKSNMAAVLVPLGIPAATTAEPDPDDIDDDPIEFQGAWCASVSSTDAVLAFSNGMPSVEREIDMAALESTEEHGAGAAGLAVVSHGTTDVREILSPEWASALEREISLVSAVFGDVAACAAAASEVDADDDWKPDTPLGTFAFVIASFSRYILMAVMCVAIIPAQRVYEFFPLSVFGIWEWISRRSNPMDALPTTFPFHHPSVDTPANIAWPHLFQSTFQPWTPVWMQQQFMVVMFWIAVMAWESVTYLLHDIGSDASKHVVRRERRRIAKNDWRHRHDRGRRLPALVFLPILWMAMANVIMIPSRFKSSLPTATTRNLKSQIFHFGQHSYHRVLSLNEHMVLDLGTWIQFDKLKAAYLLQKFATKPLNQCQSTLSTFERNANCSVGNCQNCRVNNLGMGEVINELPYLPMLPSTNINNHVSTLRSPLDQDATLLTKLPTPWTHETELASLLVSNKYPVAANGPTIIEDEDAEGYGLLGYFDEPCVFMNFITAPVEKKPVIFDTGASLAITYNKLDFDGPLTIPKGDLCLGGMANGLKIEGVGPVTWTFANSEGGNVCVKGMAYYVPKAKAQLLSPRRLFDASTGMRGRYEGDHQSFRLHLDGCPPLIVEYDDRNSLPIGYATFGAALTPHKVEPQMNLSLMDEHNNQNLTGGQKLLLQWHNRFGHLSFPAFQRILRAVPFLSAKFEAASKCELHTMKCSICEFANGHRRAKKSTTHVPNDQRTGALKVDNLKPGIQVSVDHFESRLLERFFDSYGKASSATYKGGCIFIDHCSGFLHVEHQLGFSAVESVRAKQAYEQMALHYGVVVESYLTDSGAFKANAFVQHVREHDQRIRYCGANAHHKNGVAQRAVQSVSNMARALILYASAHSKDGIDLSPWPMAVTYATYLYNHVPNAHAGLCPADIFTGSTVPRHRLKDIHVWGCPVYVLDPHLQAGQKLPRWQPRSRRGVFMGFSHLHSSEVPLILNLDTGSITPQYHVVFDDQFSTVSSVERENDPPDNWADLCLDNTTYIPTDVIEPTVSSEQVSSSLAFEWLSPAEQEWATRAMTRQDAIRGTMVTSTDGLPATATVPSSTLAPAPSPPVRVPSPPTYAQITATGLPLPHAPVPSVPVLLPAHASPIPPPAPAPPFVPPPSRLPHVPTVSEAPGLRRSSRTTKGVFQKTRYIDEAFLSSMSTSLDVDGHAAQLAYLAELFTCSDTGIVNITDPRVYAAKTPGTDSDMPTFQQAMNGSEASEYINAMRLEIQTLVGQRTWEAVTRPKDKPILKGTWAFKLKRLPDGTPY